MKLNDAEKRLHIEVQINHQPPPNLNTLERLVVRLGGAQVVSPWCQRAALAATLLGVAYALGASAQLAGVVLHRQLISIRAITALSGLFLVFMSAQLLVTGLRFGCMTLSLKGVEDAARIRAQAFAGIVMGAVQKAIAAYHQENPEPEEGPTLQ